MEVYVVLDKRGIIHTVCAEQPEAMDIAADLPLSKVETHTIKNSLQNIWRTPEEMKKYHMVVAHFREKYRQMGWFEDAELKETKEDGAVLWVTFCLNKSRKMIGINYLNKHYPNEFSGLKIRW